MASDSNVLVNPPRGMRDFYPEDMEWREALFRVWHDAARRFGFLPYDACVVESLELLKRKAGEEIVDQIYSFADKSGRLLALRPEMTPSLARMVAARQETLRMPLKWYTIAQCFRYERMTKGRKREHYQWNLDIIGEPSVTAEAEVIAAALWALQNLGLDERHIVVHFSSRALLGDILGALGVPAGQHMAVFLALDKRGKVSDEEIRMMLEGSGLDRRTTERIWQLFEIRTVNDAECLLGGPTAACSQIHEFLELLDAYGMATRVRFDLSVIRGLSYYTGIVFEAFDTARKFRAVLGGGRYDNLLAEVGGKPATGVGLGFGDVVITELMQSLGIRPSVSPPTVTAVAYMEKEQRAIAMAVATALRKKGECVDLGLRSEKAKMFFSRANKSRFARAIYIGPDDVAAGSVRIKDLMTRTEQTIPLAALTGSGPSLVGTASSANPV
ncbi:MAG: histidine--tRNA ligase [Kiritimatiellae bacterium]|nr:histidine--tRNA ligase [Kiritimatiellia bacterium]